MAIIAILVSIVFLFLAYYGYSYDYIPLLDKIKKYEDDLYKYYINQGENDEKAKELSEKDVESFLSRVYVKSTTNNMQQNEKKLKHLRHAGWSLSFVLITAVLAFIPYSFGINNDDTQKVKIVNDSKIEVEQENPIDNKKGENSNE